MSALLDTVLNVVVFAYIGLLVWLYVKPARLEKDDEPGPESGSGGGA